MFTIFVSDQNIRIIQSDGLSQVVKDTYVCHSGVATSLRSAKIPHDVDGVQIAYVRESWRGSRSSSIKMRIALKQGILRFLRDYHEKEDLTFDCYSFANLVSGTRSHSKVSMHYYWSHSRLPRRVKPGSIIFLLSGENYFHHAAIYLDHGLYISVWGGGGCLEIATLDQMMCGFGAERVVLARVGGALKGFSPKRKQALVTYLENKYPAPS